VGRSPQCSRESHLNAPLKLYSGRFLRDFSASGACPPAPLEVQLKSEESIRSLESGWRAIFALESEKSAKQTPGILIDGQPELCHESVMKNAPLRRLTREEERSLRGSNPRSLMLATKRQLRITNLANRWLRSQRLWVRPPPGAVWKNAKVLSQCFQPAEQILLTRDADDLVA
jgi:hypothetical protein